MIDVFVQLGVDVGLQDVLEDAEVAGVWANVADDPELCSFHLPGRVRRGPLQLAIASAGQAPFVVLWPR